MDLVTSSPGDKDPRVMDLLNEDRRPLRLCGFGVVVAAAVVITAAAAAGGGGAEGGAGLTVAWDRSFRVFGVIGGGAAAETVITLPICLFCGILTPPTLPAPPYSSFSPLLPIECVESAK